VFWGEVVIGFSEDGFRARIHGVVQEESPVHPAVNSAFVVHPALDAFNEVKESQQGGACLGDNRRGVSGSNEGKHRPNLGGCPIIGSALSTNSAERDGSAFGKVSRKRAFGWCTCIR
jgi:hypothetical protein